jgi:hypothetical protein
MCGRYTFTIDKSTIKRIKHWAVQQRSVLA